MRLQGTLLVVQDLEKSKTFYKNILGLQLISDFGANITLTGGLSLQTVESWSEFIGKKNEEISFGGNNAEIYFEAEDYDGFLRKLNARVGIDYVHPTMEHSWGQRGVRFYDPDKHVIEVGEDLGAVCRRFGAEGMSIEQMATRMSIPESYVKKLLK